MPFTHLETGPEEQKRRITGLRVYFSVTERKSTKERIIDNNKKTLKRSKRKAPVPDHLHSNHSFKFFFLSMQIGYQMFAFHWTKSMSLNRKLDVKEIVITPIDFSGYSAAFIMTDRDIKYIPLMTLQHYRLSLVFFITEIVFSFKKYLKFCF